MRKYRLSLSHWISMLITVDDGWNDKGIAVLCTMKQLVYAQPHAVRCTFIANVHCSWTITLIVDKMLSVLAVLTLSNIRSLIVTIPKPLKYTTNYSKVPKQHGNRWLLAIYRIETVFNFMTNFMNLKTWLLEVSSMKIRTICRKSCFLVQ